MLSLAHNKDLRLPHLKRIILWLQSADYPASTLLLAEDYGSQVEKLKLAINDVGVLFERVERRLAETPM